MYDNTLKHIKSALCLLGQLRTENDITEKNISKQDNVTKHRTRHCRRDYGFKPIIKNKRTKYNRTIQDTIKQYIIQLKVIVTSVKGRRKK